MATIEELQQDLRLNPIRLQQLDRYNEGVTLFSDNEETTYYIEVYLKIKLDLLTREETICVSQNFLYGSYDYDFGEDNLNKFLKDLKERLEQPIIPEPLQFNRRRENKGYEYSYGSDRRKVFFKNVKIVVHPLAEEYLKDNCKFDFSKVVSEILLSQRYATKKEIRLMDRLFYLKQKKRDVQRYGEYESDYEYSHYSRYDKRQDEMKVLNKREAKANIKTIEKEEVLLGVVE